MKLENMRSVERLLLILASLSIALFVAGYFLDMFFFYCFLAAMILLMAVWVGCWKCPHCGKRLWFNFDAPCKQCRKDIYEIPEKKPKNTKERTGFFHW